MDGRTIAHEPVLCGEVMEFVAPRPGEVVVDATVGHGGHARLFAQAIGESGRLIGLDVDPGNLERARARLFDGAYARPHIDLIRANFRELETVLDSLGLARVDVIFADLGVSTDQLLDPTRGLTFTEDGPLDMRLDDRLEETASDLVNALSENELSDLIFFNSQERFSRRIAKRICEVRRNGRIRTTQQLVRIVCSAVGSSPESRREKIHPATRTFLALRMAVNDEMGNLAALLEAAPRRLAPGGRIGVIAFHSGEDRVVKQDFLDRKRAALYEIATKKPIRPSSEEMQRNPRSRSAKLRVARRTDVGI
ncbi:MAG TPA: 16S rRNA (cytosine(1402)-N(4))-methyltransferase RsmH [Phycisphaerae bacterium]|nr:16S rRNA (cytosine(1402)-N(4))-methyltransferase RsmH [Phycisphaerae bacterium]HON69305.1 16S rRNA (cytosine(1402)-N(4))-methyltransferase RsmH [Phycisphaerae bacterium]HPP26269.1 16S rRNA (cytosine(1402)-N(4))-methyltransferase RsmH [Phycisphaerae bacterium]HPZ99585.1 16S rRNA (cytosine(1402)-N(4))-methyltransferase RsmH [Phycisphaerae bacterium]HQE29049.1 16S rRNA (cytosine(1402)-N(4))-methyltransferase RsmH [Phycisphaerae bacterium]